MPAICQISNTFIIIDTYRIKETKHRIKKNNYHNPLNQGGGSKISTEHWFQQLQYTIINLSKNSLLLSSIHNHMRVV